MDIKRNYVTMYIRRHSLKVMCCVIQPVKITQLLRPTRISRDGKITHGLFGGPMDKTTVILTPCPSCRNAGSCICQPADAAISTVQVDNGI